LTDSHVKIDILVDTQEPFKDSQHKVALDYDEDTMSLVEEPSLSTWDISLSDNSNSSAGNASTAFEYKYYEIDADAPRFNYHRPKMKIPKQESPVTICTADKIGTIRSQRLFWVLFDSGLNVSMIKRSALPKGIITKLFGDTKLVRTLTDCIEMQEVVTMHIPWIHLKTFKMKLNHLVRICVLASQQENEWASPSFIIPKKDDRVR
jgi:hypothetical protein